MLLKITLKYTTSVWPGERGEVGFESEDNFHKIHPRVILVRISGPRIYMHVHTHSNTHIYTCICITHV